MHFKHNRPGNLTGNNVTGLWWSFLHKCHLWEAEQRKKCWSSTRFAYCTVPGSVSRHLKDTGILTFVMKKQIGSLHLQRSNISNRDFAFFHHLNGNPRLCYQGRQIVHDHSLHYRPDRNLHLALVLFRVQSNGDAERGNAEQNRRDGEGCGRSGGGGCEAAHWAKGWRACKRSQWAVKISPIAALSKDSSLAKSQSHAARHAFRSISL